MYFVWESDPNLTDDFLYVSSQPTALITHLWKTGERLPTKPPVVTLVGDRKYASTLSDMVLTEFELPVLSPRSVSALESIGVDNIEYFPINVKHPKVKVVETSYKIANIIGLVYCLDRDHAIFQTFAANPNKLKALRQYRIFEEKAIAAGPGKKGPLVFRLGEFPYHVLVHESVKEIFEKQKLTGAMFTPTEKR